MYINSNCVVLDINVFKDKRNIKSTIIRQIYKYYILQLYDFLTLSSRIETYKVIIIIHIIVMLKLMDLYREDVSHNRHGKCCNGVAKMMILG